MATTEERQVRDTRFYAADSAGGHIDVFDSTFSPVNLGANAFSDPNIPVGFVPFNVQNISGKIYVTYALAGLPAQRAATPGQGFVDAFDEDGTSLQRAITDSQLAVPWGIALAPPGFGEFGGDLLVGSFSFVASEINAFDPMTGAFEGSIPINVGAGFVATSWRRAQEVALDASASFTGVGDTLDARGLFGRV